jgi:murein DD-endopeptidase MepM/ murein hydrolase activator NlpD
MIPKKYLYALFFLLAVGAMIFAFRMDDIKDVHLVLSALSADPHFIDVAASSNRLMQGDTLLVVVRNGSKEISGKLGTVPLYFSPAENGTDWVAIAGIPLTKKSGNYTLEITAPGKNTFKEKITVLKRIFRVTALSFTPQLQQKGFNARELADNIAHGEGQQLKSILNNVTSAAYFSKPFINPLSSIATTAPFGDIRKSGTVKIQHLGVDLGTPIGTPVVAANTGTVVFVGNYPDYGNTVVIDHGLGVYSLYLHLSEFKVTQGQTVQQGSVIALSGNTGYALGPHLHFSIKIRGASVDPLKFIQTTQALSW